MGEKNLGKRHQTRSGRKKRNWVKIGDQGSEKGGSWGSKEKKTETPGTKKTRVNDDKCLKGKRGGPENSVQTEGKNRKEGKETSGL